MIKQTQQQANDTRLLKHFTRLYHFFSISEIGIQLEGYNEEKYGAKQLGYDIADNPILKALGRYVWLTKGEQAEVINSTAHYENDKKKLEELQLMTAPIYVNDEGLELISWKLLKQQLSRKKKARMYINAFEKVAELCGDNTDDWYVSRTPIPTSHLYSCFENKKLMPLNEVVFLMADKITEEVA
ncbi:hypothetical protein N8789_00670 [bacterium]|nr:hypothetical protein [bacterium]|tara:strand:+ start:198 stop:752 length:555 start_codon:yes stop_codon:yes gene_type:complete